MKKLLLMTFLLIATNIGFGQSKSKSVKQIRSHFKWINSQKDFEIIVLNNRDFLDRSPDNGATLVGDWWDLDAKPDINVTTNTNMNRRE